MDEIIDQTVEEDFTSNLTKDLSEGEPPENPKADVVDDFNTTDERPDSPKSDVVDDFNTTDQRPDSPKMDSPTVDERTEGTMLNSFVEQTSFSPLDSINQRIREQWAAKGMEENQRRDALREQARVDLQNWYKEREQQLTAKLQRIKTEEQTMLNDALEKSSKDSCDWSKVIRMLEFSPGTPLSKSKRDLSRMKEAMINASRQQAMKNSN